MSDTEKEPIIALEGTDGAGKNTVAIALIEILLDQTDYDILHTSFPNYWCPQGTMIRQMNNDLGKEYINNNKLSMEEELTIRTSMYALDRAITFSIIDQMKKDTNKLIQISDRLFLSCVNTVAYLVTREEDSKIARECFYNSLPLALQSDTELQENTNNINAILKPKTVRLTFSESRPEQDKLESPKARDFANWGYALIPAQYKHINSFIIKNQEEDGKWKNKHEIGYEILKKSGFSSLNHQIDSRSLIGSPKSNRIKLVTPQAYFDTFYDISGHQTDLQIDNLSIWSDLMLSTNEESLWQYGKEKKVVLDEIETQLSQSLVSIMSNNQPSEEKISKLNSWPLKTINRLLTSYSNGHLLPFIEHLNKKLEYTNGYVKLIEALAST